MKAVEFSNKISSVIKDFFHRCCEQEELLTSMMQQVEFYINDDSQFTLRLETDTASYTQTFEVDDKITSMYFEIY